MKKIARRIVNWFDRQRKKIRINIDRCLDPDSQSYVGTIPATPSGPDGHRATLDVFFDLIATIKPETFCDIGANKGEAGRRALARVPGLKVFGFEADPKIHSRYKKVNVDSGVLWINTAVADQNGKLILYIPKVLARALKGQDLVSERVVEAENTGKSSLLKRDENAEYEAVEVPAVALDKFLEEHAPVGRVALWIDVEGAASLVLKGAAATLVRTDIIIVEVEGFSFWQDQALVMQVLDTLYIAGFVPVLRDREYHDAQFNIIFLRNGDDISLQKNRIGAALDKLRIAVSNTARLNQDLTPQSVPVFVPCFNNPSHAENMLVQLQLLGFANITFVDNASSSLEMHRWLDEATRRGALVERLAQNLGPRDSIFTGQRLAQLPRWFCVTDPDLQFNPALPADFLQSLADATATHHIAKAGFALDISNRHHLRQEKFRIGRADYHIWEWERKFWDTELGRTSSNDTIFRADIDTTFALYDLTKFRKNDSKKALRIGGRFTAQHLPWLLHATMLEEEARFYRANQKFSYYVR